jgi:hypothetical protein
LRPRLSAMATREGTRSPRGQILWKIKGRRLEGERKAITPCGPLLLQPYIMGHPPILNEPGRALLAHVEHPPQSHGAKQEVGPPCPYERRERSTVTQGQAQGQEQVI